MCVYGTLILYKAQFRRPRASVFTVQTRTYAVASPHIHIPGGRGAARAPCRDGPTREIKSPRDPRARPRAARAPVDGQCAATARGRPLAVAVPGYSPLLLFTIFTGSRMAASSLISHHRHASASISSGAVPPIERDRVTSDRRSRDGDDEDEGLTGFN